MQFLFSREKETVTFRKAPGGNGLEMLGKHKKAYTKFRCSNHKLNVEIGNFATVVLKITLLLTLIVNIIIMDFSNAENIRKLEMSIY